MGDGRCETERDNAVKKKFRSDSPQCSNDGMPLGSGPVAPSMPLRPAQCVVPMLVLLIAATASGDAWAQRTRDKARESHRDLIRRPAPEAEARRRHRGSANQQQALSDAVRRVERRTGGQVLSAELVPYDGRDISRIKVVDSSGRVRVYLDDPVGSHGTRRIRSDDN